MKRISGSRDQKGQGPSGFFTCWWRNSRGDVAERDDSTFAQLASRDDVFRVQLILLRGNVDLDERKRQEEEVGRGRSAHFPERGMWRGGASPPVPEALAFLRRQAPQHLA
ncbi:hypothetical protein P7K49_029674 [Saguinus oedipus]|uniref:Uncharacterized protein n=1 Tax=Saguinus oedipus TaxID=9490 RepID=A0ABQ9U8L9_SAGOE|nr:hypothetical protein P7K49_029658 [Saguinus oedipus]KAK2093145.1 hypothetical protein P7K49_029674 [Saguinus oedipus]